jgi:hypothetical protein
MTTVTDVLGTELPVTHYYGDGSYDCPHCNYAVRADEGFSLEKHNPWCIAHPGYPPDKAREALVERKRKADEEARRKREHEIKMRQIEEWNRTKREARTIKLQEAQAQGYCIACLVHSHFRKQVRHRKECPRTR